MSKQLRSRGWFGKKDKDGIIYCSWMKNQGRRAGWKAPKPAATRGYVSMYIKHVMGADKGADLDFLEVNSGSVVTRDSH